MSPSLTGVVRPAAGAGDGAEAGTRVAKRRGAHGGAAGAGAPGPAGGSSACGLARRAAAVMAVEMLGVRMEPSSFRWFNSVYHRWADRGHGAGTRTWGLAGSKTQLRGGQASREPVCWAAHVASQWSRATRATLGLMASSKARRSRRRRKGMEGGRSGVKGEMWARAAEARVAWSRVEARAPQSMRALMQEA